MSILRGIPGRRNDDFLPPSYTVPVTLPLAVWGRLASLAEAQDCRVEDLLGPLIISAAMPTNPIVPVAPEQAGRIVELALNDQSPSHIAVATGATRKEVLATLSATGFHNAVAAAYNDYPRRQKRDR